MAHGPLDTTNLDMDWRNKMPDWAITPLQYYDLVGNFATQAQVSYRREGVFLAHRVTGLKIMTTDDALKIETPTEQDAQPLIVRFDNDRYNDPRDRRKAIQRIFANKAARIASGTNINNPDFMGPDIWSWTEKQWGKEAPFLIEHPEEHGRFMFSEEGWEKTSRMVLNIPVPFDFSLPYDWGQPEAQPFKGQAGSTVAGYRHDLPDIVTAINAIDKKLKTLDPNLEDSEALRDAIIVGELFSHIDKIGQYVTRFDIYPQKEGFAQANFWSEDEHRATHDRQSGLVSSFMLEMRRTRRYGLAGHRAFVPGISRIDEMMEKHHRQQRDLDEPSAA